MKEYTRKMLLRRTKLKKPEGAEILAELIWYPYQKEGPIKGQPIEGGYYISVMPVVTKVYRTLTYTTYKADSGIKILYWPGEKFHDKVMDRLQKKLIPSQLVDKWMGYVEQKFLEYEKEQGQEADDVSVEE